MTRLRGSNVHEHQLPISVWSAREHASSRPRHPSACAPLSSCHKLYRPRGYRAELMWRKDPGPPIRPELQDSAACTGYRSYRAGVLGISICCNMRHAAVSRSVQVSGRRARDREGRRRPRRQRRWRKSRRPCTQPCQPSLGACLCCGSITTRCVPSTECSRLPRPEPPAPSPRIRVRRAPHSPHLSSPLLPASSQS